MNGLRDVVVFLAGAQAFHTLSHILLRTEGLLPLQLKMPRMTFTTRWNDVAIVFNAAVAVLLLWWAARL